MGKWHGNPMLKIDLADGSSVIDTQSPSEGEEDEKLCMEPEKRK